MEIGIPIKSSSQFFNGFVSTGMAPVRWLLISYAKMPFGTANEFERDFRRVSMISNVPTSELDRERSYLRPLIPLACGASSLIRRK